MKTDVRLSTRFLTTQNAHQVGMLVTLDGESPVRRPPVNVGRPAAPRHHPLPRGAARHPLRCRHPASNPGVAGPSSLSLLGIAL